ncbi:MAG TPA: hypothetical protein VIQ51_16550 [Chryseosolibacter sp.]
MKKIFGLLAIVLVLDSCAPTVVVDTRSKKTSQGNGIKNSPAQVKKAPPGQVKKATGSQSAKPYAPGQQKKKN